MNKKCRKNRFMKLVIPILLLPAFCNAQTTINNQIANEIQLTRSISDKFALELYLNGTFSNTPEEKQIFKTNIQRGGQFYANYFYSSRWKFTAGLTYFYNKDVPEIEQFESVEWRPSLQTVYYINKVGYTLNTRMRAEGRFFIKDNDNMDNSFRYRQMLKILKPINSQVLRQGVFYAVASEELFFRSIVKETGMRYFDRNIFIIGPGYMITDDLQIEINYMHEFIPRDNGNTLNNVFAITLTFNNLITHIKKGVSSILTEPDEVE